MIHVFVYGSLKPGKENFNRYCQGQVHSMVKAIATGDLYDLPGLGYPAMTSGTGTVWGYVLGFEDPALLATLDHLEDYDPQRPIADNDYYRDWIPVLGCDRQSLGYAWCYLMRPDQILPLGGVLLPSGHWSPQPTAELLE